MEEKLMPRIDLTGYSKDKYIIDLGNYEIKEENGKTYAVRKYLKCPKTYDIKNKLNEILSLYDKDEYRCGGYCMTQYSHITAPEDYIESRTDWDTLQNRADDMYYMLSDIKTIIEQCKALL